MQVQSHSTTILPDLIQAYGKPAHTAWLDPKYNLFFYTLPPAPNTEGNSSYFSPSAIPPLSLQGAVGFVKHSKCAVVFGEPLCAPSVNNFLQMELTNAFIAHCDKLKLKPVFMACSEDFKSMLTRHDWVAICAMKEELIKTTNNKISSNIKKSVKRATQAGVQIHEYYPESSLISGFEGYDHTHFQNEVMLLAKKWQGERKGWQMYSNQVTPFASRARWFYAVIPTQPPILVGLLTLARLSARNGYFVEYNLCHPDAPAGTTEALMQEVITTFKEENQSLSYGMAPASQLQINNSLGHFKASLAEKAYSKIYSAGELEGKQSFCRKFGIEDELNMYVCARRKDMGTRVLLALFKSLNINYSDGHQIHSSHNTAHSILNLVKTHHPFSKHANPASTASQTSPPNSVPCSPVNQRSPANSPLPINAQAVPPSQQYTPQQEPLQYNPQQFNQQQYNLQQNNTQQYLPAQYNLQQNNEKQYFPTQYNSQQYSTQQFNPQQYNPMQYNTQQYNPQQYNPQSNAQQFLSSPLNSQAQQIPQQPQTLQNSQALSPQYYQPQTQPPQQISQMATTPEIQITQSLAQEQTTHSSPKTLQTSHLLPPQPQISNKQQQKFSPSVPQDSSVLLSKNQQKRMLKKQQKSEKKKMYKEQALRAKQQGQAAPGQSQAPQTPAPPQLDAQPLSPLPKQRTQSANSQLQLQFQLQQQLQHNLLLQDQASPTGQKTPNTYPKNDPLHKLLNETRAQPAP